MFNTFLGESQRWEALSSSSSVAENIGTLGKNVVNAVFNVLVNGTTLGLLGGAGSLMSGGAPLIGMTLWGAIGGIKGVIETFEGD